MCGKEGEDDYESFRVEGELPPSVLGGADAGQQRVVEVRVAGRRQLPYKVQPGLLVLTGALQLQGCQLSLLK
jgi:hypothetical protein